MKNVLLIAMVCLLGFSASAQTGSIGGIVYGDSTKTNQNDTFKVWLIVFNSQTNILSAVDSQIVVGWGQAQYDFKAKPNGSYRTKAAHLNGPTSGTGYLPTYHSSTFMSSPVLWSNASVITHTGTINMGNHIYLAYGTVTNGPGFIGGNVSQGANKGTSSGIPNMTVLLMDANSNPIKFTTTDANGDYSFDNLPFGTYKVYPENLGDATTPASITIDATHTTMNGIIFERSSTNKTITLVTTSVANVSGKTLDLSVYPNPAHNVVNINWGTYTQNVATVVISDVTGKKVYAAQVSMNANTTVDVSSLNSGMYFMSINSANGSNTQKMLIQ
ncbi:MAG: T9SS type A sorting domain-containing protein [Chitinophagaceae bacterium]|nr:T9SS type A sorting domain-containing protein [Chitinophagaceae bacterium]MCB9047096.1 T9SS type A sorting domain-containing protein [Chitinophagales bacterium]